MWSIFIPATAESLDQLTTDLWEMGTAGLLEEADGLRAFFPDSIDRAPLCFRFNLAETAARSEAPFDPSQVAQLACDPILIGQRFFVAPSWSNAPGPPDRFRLTIDFSSAFGSGRHESTQLCMEALEAHLKPGSTVVDVGCGSGILTAAASLLGAQCVFACDIHEDSVRTAGKLVQAPLFAGSADSIRDEVADVVLANISLRVVDAIAPHLRRIAKPNGIVLIGGFLRGSTPKNFQPQQVWEKGEWQCWLCRPANIASVLDPEETAKLQQSWWL